jgi:hypothetical protein
VLIWIIIILTANCEIVVSTQWLTKYGFFTFILAKWRRRVNTKKIWTRLRHITMTTRIILTRWRHWYDATTAAEGLRNCFFLNTNNSTNKTIIEFGFRTIWRIIKPSVYRYQPQRLSLRLRLITANFGLDNSSYPAQPHSIIVKY